MLQFSVGELLAKGHGARQLEHVRTAVTFASAKDPQLTSDVEFDLELLKLDEGVHAEIRLFHTDVLCTCSRCLQKFSCSVTFPLAEREFYIERPDSAEEGEELSFIDRKHSTIDLTEMVRQEIILHTPPIPLCNDTCRGICAQCGKDLNRGPCSCTKDETAVEASKPFKHLKDIVR